MTDHARALEQAAASPAFVLDPGEHRELRAHLRGCPACAGRAARLRGDLAAIGGVDPPVSPRLHDRIREAAVTTPRSGPGLLGIIVVLTLLALGVIGASIGAGAFLAARPAPADGPDVGGGPDDAVSWQTEVVALAADEFWIDAAGLRFAGSPAADVSSDPGNLDSWTLETSWTEHGRQQRLNLYFAGDATSWWIDEARVYDGVAAAPGKQQWVELRGGPWAKTPRGTTFRGDLDLAGTGSTGPVTLHLGGLRLAVRPQDTITEPIGGAITLRELPNDAGNPFRPGGALYCSGILALAPKEAELRLLALGYKLSWRWEYSTGGNTGYAEVRSRAPDTGWISDASVGSSGELIVFVEDPERPMARAPFPALPEGCPTPAP